MPQQMVESLQKISLTQREEDLLTIFRELLDHIRAYDANGEVSKDFCMGCERNRTIPCILPKIYKAIDDLENGEMVVLIEKKEKPAALDPAFGWKRMIEIKRVGKESLATITVRHQNPRTSVYTLTTAVKDLIRGQMKEGRVPNVFDINRDLLPILDDLQKLGLEIVEHKAVGIFEEEKKEAVQ